MKKIILLSTAAMLILGVSFANDNGKEKKKKSKTSCSRSGKSCCSKKDKTAKL